MGVRSPYPGLVPYGEEDAAFFFGREADQQIVIANLIASRLTVLYGASGCGKSSVLRAGVAHRLRERGRNDVRTQGAPEFVVVSFSSWRDADPIPALVERVEQSVRATLGDRPLEPLPHGASLQQALECRSEQLHTAFLVILDQFEEYFLYHPQDNGADTFAAAFKQAMNHPALRVNFMISLREDAITLLDRFKGQIPGLIDNSLRLRHLDVAGARAGITEPLAEYNRRHPSERGPITIEPALVAEVLRQVRAGQVMVPGRGLGVVRGSGSTADSQARVEAPFLQLVLTRLWDTEQAAGSRVLRLSTLEQLGGAGRIVRTHLDTTMRRLGIRARAAAARIFQQLVTPTGTKIAHTVPDLVFLTNLPERRIEGVVKPLASAEVRVLRTVDPPVGQAGGTRYEIFHDVLAAPVLEWARQLRWRVAVKAGKYLLAAALVVAVAWGWGTWQGSLRTQRQSDARALASAAMNELEADAELSLLLSIEAAERTYLSHEGVVPEAEQALHRALDAMRLKLNVGTLGDSVVYGVALDRDLSRLATAGRDDTIRVWDAASGERLMAMAHPGRAYGVVFSPDGRLLFSAGAGGVRVWDAYSGRPRTRATGALGAAVPLVFGERSDTMWDLALSPDGALLATGGTGGVRVWDGTSGRQLVACKGPSTKVWTVAFNSDGTRVASGAGDGNARVCDARTGALVGTLGGRTAAHTAAVYGIAWGGNVLVTGSRDRTAKLWDGGGLREQVKLSGHTSMVIRVAVDNPPTRVATTSADGTVRVWDAATGRQLLSLTGHHQTGTGVRFSQNDSVLATASADGTARLWDVSPGGELPALTERTGDVEDVGFDSTGRFILTGSADGVARLWEVNSGALLREVRPGSSGDTVRAVAFGPRGTRFAVAAGTVVALYRDSGDASPLELLGHRGPVTDIAFRPDGQVFATASRDGRVILWNAISGERRDSLQLADTINAVAFSPDGLELAIASRDSTVSVWKVAGLARLGTLRHPASVTSVAFSADGRQLATGSRDWVARIWEREGTASRPKLVHSLTGHVGEVRMVAFRPGGKRLASAGSDGTLREWDVETGRELVRVTDHKPPLVSLAYSSDGSRLAAVGRDGTARVYITSTAELLNRARARVTRPFTSEECKRYRLGRSCPSQTVNLIVQGRDSARHRNFKAAVAAFEAAAKLDKTIDRSSLEHEARRLAIASLITTGERIAHQGRADSAIKDFNQADSLGSTPQVPGWALNNLCWFGSLYRHEAIVMPFCERAVARDTRGAIRDSRGVALVLSSRPVAAVPDFQAFLNSGEGAPEQRTQRRRWIERIKGGQRPWTDEEFLKLREQ